MPAGCWERPSDHTKEDHAIALNKERIGHRYPSYRYEVCREKVREYATATGHDDPRYTAETGDTVAPPTFAACMTVGRTSDVFADTELGAHWNLVHGSQEYTFHRPVRVGDALVCTPRIEDIVDRDRMELLTLTVECLDEQTKDPVVTARSTIIFFKTPGGEA